jgi:hypothetical protein
MAVVRVRRLFASFIAASIVPGLLMFVAHAQVLRDPRLPRTPAGKPILTAPAPKAPDGKPDLSGIWRAVSSVSFELLPDTDLDEHLCAVN